MYFMQLTHRSHARRLHDMQSEPCLEIVRSDAVRSVRGRLVLLPLLAPPGPTQGSGGHDLVARVDCKPAVFMFGRGEL